MVRGLEDKVVNGIVYAVLVGVIVVAVVPLLLVFSASLTPYGEVLRNGGYVVIPDQVTFSAYRQLLSNPAIPRSLLVTAFITVVGTAINMFLTTLLAYPLSRKSLPGRHGILLFILFTMVFNGGMVPTYLIVKETHLLNTVWAMIIPTAIWVFNTLVMKTFFENIPEEILDSARVDGASEWSILWRISIPLSGPVMVTLSLFYGVSHWNEFYTAILYIRDPTLQPIQVVVRNILSMAESTENVDQSVPSLTLQMAAIMIAAIPMIAVYPFVQRYFKNGLTLGAVKG